MASPYTGNGYKIWINRKDTQERITDEDIWVGNTPNDGKSKISSGHTKNDGDWSYVIFEKWDDVLRAIEVEPALSLSASTATTSSSSGTVDVSVYDCNTEWKISENTSFTTISPTSGFSDNHTIKLKFNANTSVEDRTVKVTAKYDGDSKSKYVNITQKGTAPTISITPTGRTIEYSATTTTINVTSNTTWKLTKPSSASWITISPTTGGTGTTSVSLTITEYTGSTATRTATITGTTTNGSPAATDTTKITQNKKPVEPTLSISANPTRVPANLSESTITIQSNTGWTLGVNQTWGSITNPSGSGNGTRTITISANTGSERTIKVTGTAGSLTDSVTIQQDAYVPPVTYYLNFTDPSELANYTNVACDGYSGVVHISTNLPNNSWGIGSKPSWANVSKSGSSAITITIIENDEDNTRSGEITITGNSVSPLTIPVFQQVCTEEPYISFNPSSKTNIAASGIQFTLTVSSNRSWNITGIPQWVAFNGATSGTSGVTSLEVEVLPNGTGSTRNVTITGKTVAQQGESQKSATLTLSQNKEELVFNVDTTPVSVTYSGQNNLSRGVTASTTVSWSASASDDWIVLTTSSGTGNGAVKFNVASKQYLFKDRTGTITVTGSIGEPFIIQVTQTAESYILFRDPNRETAWATPEWHQSGGTRYLKLYTNVREADFSVSTDTSWSSASIQEGSYWESGDTGGYILEVKVNKFNWTSGSAVRSFTVTFISQVLSLPASFQGFQIYLTPNRDTYLQTIGLFYLEECPDSYWDRSTLKSNDLSFDTYAAARDIEFWIMTDNVCKIAGITGTTSAIKIFEATRVGENQIDPYPADDMLYNNGNPVKNMLPNLSVDDELGPFGCQDNRTEKASGMTRQRMCVHVSSGSVLSDRNFVIEIQTQDYHNDDFNYHDHAFIYIHQSKNDYYYDGYQYMALLIVDEDITEPTGIIEYEPQTSSTPYNIIVTPYGHTFKVWTNIAATMVYESGERRPGQAINGYTENGGVKDDYIGVDVELISGTGGNIQVVNDYGHGGWYQAGDEYPFCLYVPANTGYVDTGETKVYKVTVTYKQQTQLISSFTITQEYEQIPQPHVDIAMSSGNGITSQYVTAATATTAENAVVIINPMQSNSIYFYGESGVSATTICSNSNYIKIECEGREIQVNEFFLLPIHNDQTSADIKFTNKAPSGTEYSITLNCVSDKPYSLQTNLEIHVIVP